MLQLPIKQAASELTLRTWPRRESKKTEGRQKLREPKEWPGRSRSRRRLGGSWRSVRFQIPLEQPGFNAMLGEKGTFEERFLLSSWPLKLEVCVCACAWAVFVSSLAFFCCTSAFWQSHKPFGHGGAHEGRALWSPKGSACSRSLTPWWQLVMLFLWDQRLRRWK